MIAFLDRLSRSEIAQLQSETSLNVERIRKGLAEGKLATDVVAKLFDYATRLAGSYLKGGH